MQGLVEYWDDKKSKVEYTYVLTTKVHWYSKGYIFIYFLKFPIS